MLFMYFMVCQIPQTPKHLKKKEVFVIRDIYVFHNFAINILEA